MWRQIGTKGQNNNETNNRVTSYYVSYTVDGIYWIEYKNRYVFTGNFDIDTEVLYILEPFVALAIRIHPLTWNNVLCMRLEVWCSEI